MLVFYRAANKKIEVDLSNFNVSIEKKILTKRFLLIDHNQRVVHESTLYLFTPLGLSLGLFNKVIGNCKTDEFYRGRGLYGMMVTYICENYCRSLPILFVEESNFPSIKGLEKVGFEVIDRFLIKKRILKGLFYLVERN